MNLKGGQFYIEHDKQAINNCFLMICDSNKENLSYFAKKLLPLSLQKTSPAVKAVRVCPGQTVGFSPNRSPFI